MTQIAVKDATGATQTVEAPNANGRALAAASRPVALSSEDLAVLQAATPAGENHIGEVGGRTAVVSAVLAVTASSAYATGNVVGGKITFAGMGRINGGTGTLLMAAVQSKSAQTFTCDLVLFHTDPSASTFTDKTPLSVNAADFDKVIGVFHLGDWTSLGTPSFAQAVNQGLAFKVAAGSTAIYGVLVARATPTFASTSDLTVVVKGLLD